MLTLWGAKPTRDTPALFWPPRNVRGVCVGHADRDDEPIDRSTCAQWLIERSNTDELSTASDDLGNEPTGIGLGVAGGRDAIEWSCDLA